MTAKRTSLEYKVNQVARLSGVTVRTLHHYDSIGLLTPSARSESGYRLYSEDDLLRLQTILLWRALGLPLERIRSILDDPNFDRRSALLEQRALLAEKEAKAKAMIRSVDAALSALEKDEPMKPESLFDGFDPSVYEAEAQQRWGNTDAYAESAKRTKKYGKREWSSIQAELAVILKKLAAIQEGGDAPTSQAAMDVAEEHRRHIDRWFYPCSAAMHANLAEMYVADPRFAEFFEKHGEGLAAFLSAAIEANLGRSQSSS